MRTCFVAADSRVDLTGLRQILEEEGFRLMLWSDATLSPGQSAPKLAFELIREASVVLGVLAGGHLNANALYELGVASALEKPIVLWVDDETDVPSNLRSLPVVKFAPEAPETLRFALHHAGRQESRTEESTTANIEPPRREIHRARHSHDDLALWLAEVFRQEGATVVEGQGGIGSDFALWLPDLEPSVGNPFVVEVKHSLETERSQEAAVDQMRRYLSATGGSWGMLVYRLGPPSQGIDRRWPTILVLRADELEEMLQDTSFAEAVHHLRNERAHGVR
jgi:hypothetical protein